MALVAEAAREEARRALEGDTAVARRLRESYNGRLNPYTLAAELLPQANRDGGKADGAAQ